MQKDVYSNLCKEITEILPFFTPFEQDVLSMRFGLNGGYSHTLDEVQRKFNISRERIRIIEMKVLRRMRRNKQKKENNNENKNNVIKYSSFQKEVLNIMDSLTTREQEIAKTKYGLNSGVELSDEEVLQKFTISYNNKQYSTLTHEQLTTIIEKVIRRIEHKPDELSS